MVNLFQVRSEEDRIEGIIGINEYLKNPEVYEKGIYLIVSNPKAVSKIVQGRQIKYVFAEEDRSPELTIYLSNGNYSLENGILRKLSYVNNKDSSSNINLKRGLVHTISICEGNLQSFSLEEAKILGSVDIAYSEIEHLNMNGIVSKGDVFIESQGNVNLTDAQIDGKLHLNNYGDGMEVDLTNTRVLGGIYAQNKGVKVINQESRTPKNITYII